VCSGRPQEGPIVVPIGPDENAPERRPGRAQHLEEFRDTP
jgi:hypothetical protein